MVFEVVVMVVRQPVLADVRADECRAMDQVYSDSALHHPHLPVEDADQTLHRHRQGGMTRLAPTTYFLRATYY